jgi:cytoskeletal protein CcmA (bactofilin family)
MLPNSQAERATKPGLPVNKPKTELEVPSVIAEGIEIIGDLNAETEIQVNGTVRGNLKANRVIIGRTGMIDGSINADTVTIDGTILGNTIAKEAALEAHARIEGEITISGDMSMAAGARLQGAVTIK